MLTEANALPCSRLQHFSASTSTLSRSCSCFSSSSSKRALFCCKQLCLVVVVILVVSYCQLATADSAFVVAAKNVLYSANGNYNRRVVTSSMPPFGVSTIPRSFLDIDRLDLNCPEECACSRGYINCTARALHYVPTKNRRTNYTSFLPHAMWLNDNQFGIAIASSNFSDWWQLKTLSLRNCSIRRVTSMTFAYMTRLAILDLSLNGNRLVIDALAFSGTNLEALLLDDNPGIVFNDKAFENATIRSVRIRRCKLTTLSPDLILPMANSLESLFASENEITSLSSRLETIFSSISFFDVSKNPWICDCAVDWLVRVYVNRLNRTRSLNPVDEWGSASSHGLPVPACVTPSQRAGMLIDSLHGGGGDDLFVCSTATVIGIDVEHLRERNQTRFRCTAAGNPVASVSWYFPRAEDEYNWALSLVENSTTVVVPTAYSSTLSTNLLMISQAFLTVMNRPAVTIAAPGGSTGSYIPNTNQVRLVCKATNSMGSASLMTTFDATQRQQVGPELPKPPYNGLNGDVFSTLTTFRSTSSKPPSTPAATTKSTPKTVTTASSTTKFVTIMLDSTTTRSRSQNGRADASPEKLLTSGVTLGVVTEQSLSTNIPIGYDDGEASFGDENTTAAVATKWQDGENMGMNQQSIPQGILVTVAVLVAIVMSSLGGCCLVIACSTSKVPNCPNIKHAPSRCRESSLLLPPPGGQPVGTAVAEKAPTQDVGNPKLDKKLDEKAHKSNPQLGPSSAANSSGGNGNFTSSGTSPGRRGFMPMMQTTSSFTTFRASIPLDRSTSPSRDEAYSEARNDANARRHHSYYGHGRGRNNLGLNLFLSPPPPGTSNGCGVTMIDCGAEINRNNSNSYPGNALTKQRFLSNSQNELCTCSPDLAKNKEKSSSGYRSLVLNGSDVTTDDLDASGGNSGIRSSEPGDDILLHPVACFSPVHDNDIVRKTCIPVVTTEEITFI